MKKLILTFVLALPFLTWADQPVQKGERIDDANIIYQTPAARTFEAFAEEAVGEPVMTVLEPEFQQLEDRYTAQLNEIQAQINQAQPEQQEALERQAIALKQQLHEERLEVILSYVQARGDKDAEARVLKAIEDYRNPVPIQRVRVDRDPVTGTEKGGSK